MKATESTSNSRAGAFAPSLSISATARRINGIAANTSGSLNVLLLSTLFRFPYRILRCTHAAGANIYVLGTQGAKGLSNSRYCKTFIQTDCLVNGDFNAELAKEINQHVRRLGIDMVLPGDAPSTRSLIAIRDLIVVPCFPMPELSQFDLLNDKWQFTTLCRSLGIECPPTRLFADREELNHEIEHGALDFPLIAKPLSMDGGVGCIALKRETACEQLRTIFYRPILVQNFIEGEDIGASVYCEQGVIKAFIAHHYRRATYTTFFDDTIYNNINKLVRSLKVDGVFNFDMRLEPNGRVSYLECNPRFFFKIAMSALAGINFVGLGLPGHNNDVLPKLSDPVTIRFPKAMLATLHMPWKLREKSWPVLKFLFSDPMPYFREELGLEKDPGQY